ncbi:hypothetical protein [Promicromonospora sukumoe]|uniref:hypothetical protein n=1 Tax=Promicromonospora sukumoe TaxID=88382 RepID=UPI000363F221|nr:hypothetical protein [Promicromonospora sukumoe]
MAAAEQLYESRGAMEVVDAADVDAAGTPRPRWTIEFSGCDARVRFLDRHGAVWRQVDYRTIDGRLWRQRVSDYTYPDGSRLWEPSELMSEVESVVHPDGTGSLTILDKTKCKPGTWLVSQFSARASEAYWVDRPEFGGWAALTHPGRSAHEVAGTEAAASAR